LVIHLQKRTVFFTLFQVLLIWSKNVICKIIRWSLVSFHLQKCATCVIKCKIITELQPNWNRQQNLAVLCFMQTGCFKSCADISSNTKLICTEPRFETYKIFQTDISADYYMDVLPMWNFVILECVLYGSGSALQAIKKLQTRDKWYLIWANGQAAISYAYKNRKTIHHFYYAQ